MSDDRMREAFEKAFPIPEGCHWHPHLKEYTAAGKRIYGVLDKLIAYNKRWETWQAACQQPEIDKPEIDKPWTELAAALYQACGAYDLPERILDILVLAASDEPFGHLVDGLLPCCPEPEKPALTIFVHDGNYSLDWHVEPTELHGVSLYPG